jgi:PD-(D/E)XK nuclease superfamily protein
VAVSPAGKVCRLQVKYKSMRERGIRFNLRSSYADRNGSHIAYIDRSLFDAYAVYCPETNKIYYIRNNEIPDKLTTVFKLRLEASRNNQLAGIHMASDFEGMYRLFEQ